MPGKTLYTINICFLIICLAANVPLSAQEYETDSLEGMIELPSVEVDTEDEIYYFNDVSQQDKSRVSERKLDQGLVEKVRTDEAFWYVNKALVKEVPEEKKSPVSFRWIDRILWILVVGGFAVILIWFLLSSNVRLFRRGPVAIQAQDDTPEEEDIFSIRYEKEIAAAISSGKYREAIRYLFLRLLKNMSEQSLIQYKSGRTNSDYLAQLYGTTFYHEFFRLVRHYEYAWYGQFLPSEEEFMRIRNEYEQFSGRWKS
jgi:hypothetical protein